MADYDSPWKEVLDRYFKDFMAFFFPTIYTAIDWSRGYEMLDKELQQIVRESRSGRLYVDKLVKVWRKDGREEWLLIHVEVQGKRERAFAKRMYVYNHRLEDRYERTVVSLAVLTDEDRGWRPDRYNHELWGCSVDFRFPTVKLLDYAGQEAALEAHANPFATVVLAHLKMLETRGKARDRRSWKFRIVKGLYERGWNADDVRQLFRFIDWVMELPTGLEAAFWQELSDYQETRRMRYITSVERYGMRAGYLRGIEECLHIKFGPEALDLMPEIRQLDDHEILLSVLETIQKVDRPEDLRRVWSKPRKNGTRRPRKK